MSMAMHDYSNSTASYAVLTDEPTFRARPSTTSFARILRACRSPRDISAATSAAVILLRTPRSASASVSRGRSPSAPSRTLPDISGHVSAGPRERVGPREREHRAKLHVLVEEADPGLLLPRLPVAVIATNSEGKQFAPEPESLVRASTRPRKANPPPLRRNSRQNQVEHAAFCGTLRRNQGVARSSPKRCVNS